MLAHVSLCTILKGNQALNHHTEQGLELSRRNFLNRATTGLAISPLALLPQQARSQELLTSLANQVSVTSGSLIDISRQGPMTGGPLNTHFQSLSAAFSYLSEQGLNGPITNLATIMLNRDPSILNRSSSLIHTASQQSGVAVHPSIFQAVPETNVSTVLSRLGGDISYLQNDVASQLMAVAADLHSMMGVSFDRHEISRRYQRLKSTLYRHAVAPEPGYLISTDYGFANSLFAGAAALAAAGLALIAAAVATPAILGVGALAGLTTGILYTAGVLAGIGSLAVAYYGVQSAIRESYHTKLPPRCVCIG